MRSKQLKPFEMGYQIALHCKVGGTFTLSSWKSPGADARRSNGEHTRDVRRELICAAHAILHDEGLEKLSLRRVAARVGVSHAAPAHHFRGLPHLLGTLCGIGFEELSDAMETRADAAGEDPQERLVAICEAYVDYSVRNPGLIELMFNAGKERVEKAAFGSSGQRAYKILRDACTPFEPISEEADSLETLVWSTIHGFAFLKIGGRFANPSRATPEPQLGSILTGLALKYRQSPVSR